MEVNNSFIRKPLVHIHAHRATHRNTYMEESHAVYTCSYQKVQKNHKHSWVIWWYILIPNAD